MFNAYGLLHPDGIFYQPYEDLPKSKLLNSTSIKFKIWWAAKDSFGCMMAVKIWEND